MRLLLRNTGDKLTCTYAGTERNPREIVDAFLSVDNVHTFRLVWPVQPPDWPIFRMFPRSSQ